MEEFRGWKLALATFGIFLLVTASGYGFDRMLHRDGVNRKFITASANALTGLVVADDVPGIHARTRRTAGGWCRHRLEVIADMNHHIRNALQVLSYGTATHGRKTETEMMRDSIERIEWALARGAAWIPAGDARPHEPAPPNTRTTRATGLCRRAAFPYHRGSSG